MDKSKVTVSKTWKAHLKDRILAELGIKNEDIQTYSTFAKLLHSPRDPSGLAVIRILFGKFKKI